MTHCGRDFLGPPSSLPVVPLPIPNTASSQFRFRRAGTAPDPIRSSSEMAPPALMDDLVEDVLLRFPPDNPASLVRAALVCKPWCRIVSSEGFRRRFREFHRRPPVLGLLCNFRRVHLYDDEGYVFRFVPTASFPGNRAFHYNNRRAIDARHGRILLRGILWEDDDLMNDEFVVWDPMTREERMLPALPRYPHSWNAAVLCAAHPSGACDHLDCHRGPFLVVFVVVDTEAGHMFVHVYSSETGSWSEQTVPHPNKPANWLWPSVLVGNALYFMLGPRRTILKYNLGTRDISMIDLPPILYKPDVLTTTEDGRLGFAAVRKSRLCLWSREAGPERDAGWAEIRVIELEKLLPADALLTSPTVVGFADGMGIVFVGTQLGVFSIDLKSQQAKNVYDGNGCDVLPYMSFYIPAVGAASMG